MNNVSFEADPTVRIAHDQAYLIGCTDYETKQIIGWVRKDLASLVDSANYIIETETGITTYNLATCTFQCWVKLKSSSEYSAFFSLPSTTNSGMYLQARRSTNQIYGSFNTGGGGATVICNGCNDLFASNTTSGPFSDGWHHLAFTLAGGVAHIYLDGTKMSGAGDVGVTPAPVSGRFIIGGNVNNDNPGAPVLPVDGMISSVSVLNIDAYGGSNFTITKEHRNPKPNGDTVGLWGYTTTGPKIWEDQMHNHDAALQDVYPAPWVGQTYTP
jgi:hypothetical protein